MKLGILFSGGKDSTLAMHIAAQKEQVTCLITVASKNKESFMFHTPNIDITALQAEALGLPLVTVETEGKKEEELADLEKAILQAKETLGIEGVVTGAVESVYQSERVQRICSRLDLWCFNPLWKHDQRELLEELLERGFEVLISGVFAYPLDESWLGKRLDQKMITRLVELQNSIGLSPTGEGGEIETTVLDAPLFKQKIQIQQSETVARGNSGVFRILKAGFVAK
ncbi:MAG: diphthine--ammonia ligase [Candidatus Bathyarchaeota archaeon]|nr:diphthine--ammonia ligase [Candidatus Bathyarchaeota archaeon]